MGHRSLAVGSLVAAFTLILPRSGHADDQPTTAPDAKPGDAAAGVGKSGNAKPTDAKKGIGTKKPGDVKKPGDPKKPGDAKKAADPKKPADATETAVENAADATKPTDATAADAKASAAAPTPANDAAKSAGSESKEKKEAEKKAEVLPPRPPPFAEDLAPAKLPSKRRVDIGTEVLLVNVLADDEIRGAPSRIAYKPAIGFEFHARVQVFRYFQLGAYFCGSAHTIQLGEGALGTHGSIDSDDLQTIWFGLKAMPTLPIGERVRLWGSVGAGWGRFEFPQMKVHEAGHDPFFIKGRGNSFVEIPIGIGASFELVKNWLSLDMEMTAAPLVQSDGSSFVTVQAIDNGHERVIQPEVKAHTSFVHAIGLSLLL